MATESTESTVATEGTRLRLRLRFRFAKLRKTNEVIIILSVSEGELEVDYRLSSLLATVHYPLVTN